MWPRRRLSRFTNWPGASRRIAPQSGIAAAALAIHAPDLALQPARADRVLPALWVWVRNLADHGAQTSIFEHVHIGRFETRASSTGNPPISMPNSQPFSIQLKVLGPLCWIDTPTCDQRSMVGSRPGTVTADRLPFSSESLIAHGRNASAMSGWTIAAS
jgi:hypothetical protein